MNLADPNLDDFVTQNDTFADLAGYEYWLSSVSGGSEPVRVSVASVSRGFFVALGTSSSRSSVRGVRPHSSPSPCPSAGRKPPGRSVSCHR